MGLGPVGDVGQRGGVEGGLAHGPEEIVLAGFAGALELLGNLPSFDDRIAHATINLDNPDPRCALPQIVANQPRRLERVNYVLNNSFGMLGINSVVIVKRFSADGS